MKAHWATIVLAMVPAGIVLAQTGSNQSQQFDRAPLAQFGGQVPEEPEQEPQPPQPPGQPAPPQPGQFGGPQPGQPGGPQQGRFGGPPQGIPGPPPNLMFSIIDVDGDGVITKAELRKAIVQLRKLDADKDGNLTLAEVSPFGGPMGPMGNPAQFIQTVMANDKNGDGQLTADETPDNLKPLLHDADLNNDSVVTRDELGAVMQNMQNRFPGGPWNQPGGIPGQRGFGNRMNDTAQMAGRLLRGDRNNDGKLSADELPANMRGMFQASDDLDGDGSLNAAELNAVIERMGDRARALRGGIDPEEMRERARGDNRRGRNRPQNEE
jgi:Ca2+-binding EF-hand superfamily protein